MKKKDLIQKWLDNNLNEEELKAFKNLDAYASLNKIDQAAKYHKAPAYDAVTNYERLSAKLNKPKNIFYPKIWWVAAIIAGLIVGVYFTQFYTTSTQFKTDVAVFEKIALPDASSATLMPDSEISFDAQSWKENRNLNLKGEAFFDVAKGSAFTVQTRQGDVTVLGTQFTVIARDTYFEVSCYEGSVEVKHKKQVQTLLPGTMYRFLDGTSTLMQRDQDLAVWSQETTHFKSIPLGRVFETLERNYNITIKNKMNETALFTGAVSSINLKDALNSATMPFNINYTIIENIVTLKKND